MAVKKSVTKDIKATEPVAEVNAPVAEVKAEAKKEEAVKAPAKKEAAKKAPAKKETEKKETVKKETVKKETAKKAPAKKAVAKKVSASVFVEYAGNKYTMEDVVERAKADYVANGNSEASIKEFDVYVKPEDYAAYYVVNGEIFGRIWL